MATLRPIIYNLHRLIDRCTSPSPTGVDRVDLHYAQFILQKAQERPIYFLRQRQNVSYLVRFKQAASLINTLEKRWLQGLKLPQAPINTSYDYLRHWPATRFRQQRQLLIDPALRHHLSHSTKPPIYLHSGHGTLHHIDLHEQIKTQLQADMLYYLHDLIPIEFPEYTNHPNALAMHQRRLKTMATTGRLILANSEDSRQKLLAYCQQHQLPQPEVQVLFIGVEELFIKAAQQAKQPIPSRFATLAQSPYFLTIGTVEARKNHLLLLHLWRQLFAELGEHCPKLVILGKRGWKAEHIFHLLDSSPALQQTVIEIQDANDQEMLSLIQNTQALLFPSFAEGWGMPLAEALTLNTKAICSDLPALRECGRTQSLYLNPLDGLAWKAAILNALSEPPQLKQAYLPDRWEDHLQKLDELLISLEAKS